MANITAVAEVRLWEHRVGAVAEDEDGVITFEYDDAFRATGLDISPIHLPLSTTGPIEFPELRRLEAFDGLPGVLADALPDRFGNAVIRRYFQDRGEPDRAMSPVQKLLYIGDRAIGALRFRPALKIPRENERAPLEIAELVSEARSIVEGRTEVAVPEIIRVGSSAGGMRPKALVLWNPKTEEIRSGYAPPRPGDEHWMLKFDGVRPAGSSGEEGELRGDQAPRPYMRIEHGYSQLAARAGLDVVETRILNERDYAHLLIRRFDRVDGDRLHQHTLGGLHHIDYNQPGAFSYEEYLRTVLALHLGYEALTEAYRRAVFNVAAVNQDDHVKNLSFLLEPDGTWRLSPAYDLTFALGHGWTRTHQMTLGGKREGITRADLEALAEKFDIERSGSDIIDKVASALAGWEEVASAAGVPRPHIIRIREQLRERGIAEEPD